jgi:hypothetical protein
MTAQYCPAWGPGSPVCPRSICDCFIDEFPDDMEAAGGLHPEFFTVMPPVPDPRLGTWERCTGCGNEFAYPHLCRQHMLCGICHQGVPRGYPF